MQPTLSFRTSGASSRVVGGVHGGRRSRNARQKNNLQVQPGTSRLGYSYCLVSLTVGGGMWHAQNSPIRGSSGDMSRSAGKKVVTDVKEWWEFQTVRKWVVLGHQVAQIANYIEQFPHRQRLA